MVLLHQTPLLLLLRQHASQPGPRLGERPGGHPTRARAAWRLRERQHLQRRRLVSGRQRSRTRAKLRAAAGGGLQHGCRCCLLLLLLLRDSGCGMGLQRLGSENGV